MAKTILIHFQALLLHPLRLIIFSTVLLTVVVVFEDHIECRRFTDIVTEYEYVI